MLARSPGRVLAAPIRVLLVDDSQPMRMVARLVLGLDGRIEVLGEAADGGEAVRLAERLLPDCVLLDLGLPVLNGLDALTEIKRRAPQSKVVVFSGFDGGETVAQALAAGADACLAKPDGVGELTPTIVRVCGAAPG